MKKHNMLMILPFLFFLLFSCSNERIVFETTHLKLGIDNNGFISRLTISFNNNQFITIDEPLKAGDCVVYDGEGMYITDAFWKPWKKANLLLLKMKNKP